MHYKEELILTDSLVCCIRRRLYVQVLYLEAFVFRITSIFLSFVSQTEEDILLRTELEALSKNQPNFSLWYTVDKATEGESALSPRNHYNTKLWAIVSGPLVFSN